MVKKFVIKEAWILSDELDENGERKKMKLTPLSEDAIPTLVEIENVRGGKGNTIKLYGRDTVWK